MSVPEKPGRGIIEHPTDKAKFLHFLTVRPELATMADFLPMCDPRAR